MTHTRDVPSYFLNPFPFDAICIYLIIIFFLFIYLALFEIQISNYFIYINIK